MKNKILIVLCGLFGLMMLNSGLNKFFWYMPMPEPTPEQATLFAAFATIAWIFPLVAVAEIIGGILIAIPKTRALGALIIFPVMVGIVIHHAVHDPSTIAIALVLFAINVAALLESKDKFLPILK